MSMLTCIRGGLFDLMSHLLRLAEMTPDPEPSSQRMVC